MDFTRKLQLGFIMRIEGKFVVAFGVAEFYKRYSFARLPGGGLLLYARVVAGFAPYRVAIPMG